MFKRIICLAISVTIAAGISACGSNGKSANSTEKITNSTEKSANSSDSTDENEKTITISTIRSNRYLELAIEKYKEIHPDITVELKAYAASGDVMSGRIDSGEQSNSGKDSQPVGKDKNIIITGDNDSRDIEKYVNTLNTEIMTGKGPDIISVDMLPYKKYADKNLLADLSALIQSDKGFDINRYYKGILDAVKYKGNLYAFPIKFTFNMLNGDKTNLDDTSAGLDDSKWTWQDFKAIAEKLIAGSNRQDMTALSSVSELELLNYVMGSSYDRFIDMKKKDADFKNPEFAEILNFCKELLDKKLVDTNMESMMTGGRGVLFYIERIITPMDYMMLPQMQFKGNGKLYRLPGNGGTDGISFSSDAMFAINNNSRYKNEAWEFIKYLLSDEIQSTMELAVGAVGFPVNREAAKANALQSLERSRKSVTKTVGPDGEVVLKPATEEDVAAMEKVLEEVSRYDGADRAILKIILEEADSFFKGRKSIEEVTSLMQNRVNTYLKE